MRFSRLLLLTLTLLLLGTDSFAQATRTWVSSVGDDVNPCSRTAPCKTFAGAISKTAAGGEIDVMDDGAFGAVTITKSLTIDGGGHIAGVLATTGANGIVINAASTDVVTLRRLQIHGANSGANGVRILGAKHVNIQNTEIFRFTGHGVDIQPGTVTLVQIADSRIENNGNAAVYANQGNVTIKTSTLVGNGIAGVDATGTGVFVLVSNSNVSMNGRGLRASGNATIRMTHNDILLNTVYAWEASGGVIETHSDNRTRGATLGTLTKVIYP